MIPFVAFALLRTLTQERTRMSQHSLRAFVVGDPASHVVRSLAEAHTPGLQLLARGTRQRLVQFGPARSQPAPAG
jgi:hypothetical protein